jgi:L-rhamnose-H+ transport protein
VTIVFASLLAVIGGLMNGSFMVPARLNRRWPWENMWLIFSLVGFVVVPLLLILIQFPRFFDLFAAVGFDALLPILLLGLGYGVGTVLLGLGTELLGIALGFAIILGLNAVLGAMIPAMVLTPQVFATFKGGVIVTGLAVAVVGIIFCARAGRIKEAALAAAPTTDIVQHAAPLPSRLWQGLLVCIGSGIMLSAVPLAMAFGDKIAAASTALGAGNSAAQNVVLTLVIVTGAIINIVYTGVKISRNDGWTLFAQAGHLRGWAGAVAMGVLWMGGVLLYGLSSAAMGVSNAAVAWLLFIIMIILSSNFWGWWAGEWVGAPRAAMRANLIGVACLIGTVLLVGMSAGL